MLASHSGFGSTALRLLLAEIQYDSPDDIPLDVRLWVIGPGLGCGGEGLVLLDTLRENHTGRQRPLLRLASSTYNVTIG